MWIVINTRVSKLGLSVSWPVISSCDCSCHMVVLAVGRKNIFTSTLRCNRWCFEANMRARTIEPVVLFEKSRICVIRDGKGQWVGFKSGEAKNSPAITPVKSI
jgi:hypothetical protein